MLVVVGTNQICNTHLYIFSTNVVYIFPTHLLMPKRQAEQMGEAFWVGLRAPQTDNLNLVVVVVVVLT